jgi:hypothetical protein
MRFRQAIYRPFDLSLSRRQRINRSPQSLLLGKQLPMSLSRLLKSTYGLAALPLHNGRLS